MGHIFLPTHFLNFADMMHKAWYFFREIMATPWTPLMGDNFSRNLLTVVAFDPICRRQSFMKLTLAYLSKWAGTPAAWWSTTQDWARCQILNNINILVVYVLNLPLNLQNSHYHSQRAEIWNLIWAPDSHPLHITHPLLLRYHWLNPTNRDISRVQCNAAILLHINFLKTFMSIIHAGK